MINGCSHKNLLVRDGASQYARVLKSLDPSFAAIDERSLTDLIQFLKKYASELTYYHQENKPDGTWEIFLQNNCVCLLSDIVSFNSKNARNAFKKAAENISSGSPAQVSRQLKNQFDLIFTLIFEAEKWYRHIDRSLLLYNEIRKEIISGLSMELFNVISWYKKGAAVSLVDTTLPSDQTFEYPVKSSEEILINNTFSEAWYRYKDPVTDLPYSTWTDYYNSIAPSDVYQPSGSPKDKALYTQYFLQRSIDKTLSSYGRILVNRDLFLNDMLTNYPSHEPHTGLLLSFLQLFDYARDQINTLTRRHLDFYLEDVLGLKKKEAVADKAFIIFELAKGIDKYKVAKDTSLSAGKDDTGKEVLFFTAKESVINRSSVSEIKSIYVDFENDYRVYASPCADSSDGKGADFTEDPGRWKPFGESQKSRDNERTMPDASIGFLITSGIFELSEGKRKIKVDIHCDLSLSDLSADFLKTGFNVHISGEKGWIEYIPAIITNTTANDDIHTNHLIFNHDLIQLLIEITEDKDPVVALDPSLHDARFDFDTPGIFIECSHTSERYAYNFLKNIRISRIDINVSSDKTKNLLLQNDQSSIDPAKPFNPFGTNPRTGSSFIIGSKEVFSKKLTKLVCHGIWNDFPTETGIEERYDKYGTSIHYYSFTASAKGLYNGQWTESISAGKLHKSNIQLFTGNKDATLDLTLHDNKNDPLRNASLEDEPENYDINSGNGFIKLELEDNNGFAFGHQLFPKVYAEEAIEQAIANQEEENPSVDLPDQPYTPAIKDFYIEYSAVAQVEFGEGESEETNDGKFCQVFPFGFMELLPGETAEDLCLLPQFSSIGEGTTRIHNGELIIGLENAETPVSLELLFKVAEGSEDPELPSQQLNWFYLKDDKWTKFGSSEILADNTNNLTTTGILSLSVPKLSNVKPGLLQKDLLWIMASVTDNTDAACEIIAIHPRAVLSEFKNNDNDPQRTGTALASDSITKLKVKDPNIKTIEQPYSSFGGKVKETSGQFYLRTSERLRHKERGITIWDYERIILQEFPDLYKVKCINHTAYGYYDALADNMDSEFAPGYVTVIVIPKTYNQNAVNPYEPRVTKAELLQIQDMISKKISPFAARKLKIINPLYEQIKLEFEVEFHKEYTDRGFYEKQLNEDIKKYLSPWAYSEGKDIILGGRIHKSVLIDFIEELSYVDYLKDVKMHQYINKVLYKADITTAYPSTARSAFVTINDQDYRKEHIIKKIT